MADSEQPSPRSGTPLPPQQQPAQQQHAENSDPAMTSRAESATQPPTSGNAAAPKPSSGTSASFVPPWRRPTMNVHGADNGGPRRPSVQFVPTSRSATSRSSSAQPGAMRSKSYGDGAPTHKTASGRRLSSPPPPAQFRPSVSFDTFANPAASDFSLTLNRKHRDYVYTKRSRTFLCGTDTNDYSDTALEWLIDELVDDGDEVVCLRVVEKDSKEAIRCAAGQGEKGYREEAHRFLEAIEKKNTDDRAISLVLEFSIGKVHDTIQQMIRIYEPAILVVGTRGRSLTGYHGLLSSGSVSKYCLQYSPVPVIVVRPSSKREAKKRKRQQDPARSGYRDILDKSEDAHGGRGGHLLDASNRSSLFGADLGALGDFGSTPDPDDEARRVAEAIGWPRSSSRGGSRPPTGSDGGPRSGSLTRPAPGTVANEPPSRVLMSPDLGRQHHHPSADSDDEDDLDSLDGENYFDEHDYLRPQDEAAMKAYEAGVRNAEDVREEAAARAKKAQDRSASHDGGARRGRKRNDDDEEGGGAAVLGLLAQLDRGIR